MSKSTASKSDASTRNAQATPLGMAKKTKFIIAAAAGIVILGGVIIASRPDGVTGKPVNVEPAQSVPASSNGRLATLQTKYDFGTVSMAKGKVTHRYAVKNMGAEPVVIHKLYTSCMCTTAALVKNGKTSEAYSMPGHTPVPVIDVPINSQEDIFVEVVFDPAAHGPAGVGPIERVVTLENNAGQPLELGFTAMVTP